MVSSNPAAAATRPKGQVVKVIGSVVALALLPGMFWLADGADWVGGWIFLGVLTVGMTVNTVLVKRKDPELLRRRGEYGEGTKLWDRVLLAFFGIGFVAIIVVAALDARFEWRDVLPLWVAGAGAALFGLSIWLLTWAMLVNTHFEKTVRIQTDRDHKVIDSGPYRFVRHPGYVATIFGFVLGSPLMLRSATALIPAVVTAAVLVVRTALEDRTLRAELQGYEDYAARVSYRLMPGLW